MIFEEDEDKSAGSDDFEKDFNGTDDIDEELFDDELPLDEVDADRPVDDTDEEDEIASDVI